jgi:EAL domain-containing protein (putative c-di-GMP-specific phosphodiesterase class I)
VAKERLTALRAAGFRIAIDDFGSGYSNLGQLLGVPCDIIKIDRSLLLMLTSMRDQMGGDPSSPCAIMSAIVSIASVFEARVVCEGVETELQRYSLERSGITHVQGYLMGRPVPADEISSPSVLTH